jgi:hypothetical protein
LDAAGSRRKTRLLATISELAKQIKNRAARYSRPAPRGTEAILQLILQVQEKSLDMQREVIEQLRYMVGLGVGRYLGVEIGEIVEFDT